MRSEIRHRPSFSTLYTSIPPGETIVAESDAMASMTPNTRVIAKFNGGFLRALLLRIFGGESLFVNFFSSKTADPAEVVFTQNTRETCAKWSSKERPFSSSPERL